jgi:leucyl aminopeptidase (aminopeptidase T)
MQEAASILITDAACLKEKSNVLVICGLHNKMVAEHIVSECQAKGANPHLWVFDERTFRKPANNVAAILPIDTCVLLKRSDLIIWLSQFEDLERFTRNLRKAMISYWDTVYETVENKPRLLVNLPSAKYVEKIGINYENFLKTFINAVKVDYGKLREVGSHLVAKLDGKKLVHVQDSNGTDLTFNIEGRSVGVEVGTLEQCFSSGKECEVDVPAGEVYVAPIETSANGTLVVYELKEYGIRGLELHFKKGKIVDFKAEKGSNVFQNIMMKAEGDKDKIAELGIGINHGMKPIGWSIYDEKALGTAHIAIGNNTHLGGTNKASIHIDFILLSPNIEVDNEPIMQKGRLKTYSG